MIFQKYFYYFTSIFTLLGQMKPWPRILGLFLGKKSAENPLVEIRNENLRFRARSAMDVWSLKETLVDHFYEKYGFLIGEGWCIVDIGGGIGDFTILAAHNHPGNQVVALEPTPSSFALLQENLEMNHISNAQAFQKAVWSTNDDIVIDTGMGEPVQFTSQALQDAPAVTPGKVVVQGITLQSLFADLEIDRCDLMKLDCEGAEYEILFKAPDIVLNKIDRIVMEYHDNAGPYTHVDMQRFLTEHGYAVQVFPNVVHSYIGYLRAARPETREE